MAKKLSLSQKTLNGIIWSGSSGITKSVLQIAFLAILARLIGAKSFGIIQAAMIVVGFAHNFSQMGVGPALVQRKEITENHIRVGFTISLTLGLLLATIVYFLSGPLANFFEIQELAPVLKIFSILFITGSFVTISMSLLQRNMQLKEIAIVEISSYFLGYGIIGVTFGYLGYDYWTLVIAIFSQEIFKIFGYLILKRHSFLPQWNKQAFQDLIHYGGGHTLAKMANTLADQGSNIIIGKFLGPASLGYFGRAYTLMIKPYSLVANALDSSLFPAMSSIQHQKSKLKENYIKMTRVLGLICIPMTAFFVLLAEPIVMVILGPDWRTAIVPLQILSLTIVFRINSRISDVLVRSTGDIYARAWRKTIYAFVMIGSCYIGHYWGLNGVCVAIVFAVGVNFILMGSLTLKIINMKWWEYILTYKYSIQVALITTLLLYIARSLAIYLSTNNLIVLLVSLILSIIPLLIILKRYHVYFLGEEKEYIQLILNRVKIPKGFNLP